MRQDEMQRILDEAFREGKSELEAYRFLCRILGIHYPVSETEEASE